MQTYNLSDWIQHPKMSIIEKITLCFGRQCFGRQEPPVDKSGLTFRTSLSLSDVINNVNFASLTKD
uniref:Uncharacterized protein n=1 Tax=Romanomermis culicivorax TaxID=13658 RepID=A0A915HXV2_ROMCU